MQLEIGGFAMTEYTPVPYPNETNAKESKSFRTNLKKQVGPLKMEHDSDVMSEITAKPPQLPDIKTEATWQELLYDYSLMVWDGLGFFGFDDTKLDRLRGKKVTFFTKFKSVKWSVATLMTLTAVLYVVGTESSKLYS